MAKIAQVITRPAEQYDYTVAEAQTRDLDAIVEKLNSTFQEELKDEIEAFNFFIN
jgi:hypothetical protein